MTMGGIGLIATAIALAWFPILGGYPNVADEHAFRAIAHGGMEALIANAAQYGIWRSIGVPIQAAAAAYPAVVPWVAISIHAGVCLLIFHLALALGAGRAVAVGAALVFGIYPFGYQCLTNTMCLTMMISTALLLGWLYLLMRERPRPGAVAMAVIGAVTAFVAGCIYESLVFCFAVSGPAVFLIRDWRRGCDRRLGLAAMGSAMGAGLYLVLYKLLPGADRPLSPVFNPESLLGAWWWQWSNAWVFEPLFLADARSLMFYDWGLPQVVAAVVLGGATIAMALRVSVQASPSVPPATGRWSAWAGILLLLLAASAVFVFAGYSTDSRKKYCLLPLAILALCRLIAEIPAVDALIARRWRTLVSVLLPLGVATTWLVLGIYRFEMVRHDALLRFLRGRDVSGEIKLRPDSAAMPWPRMPATLGFGFFERWVLMEGLGAAAGPGFRVTFGPDGAAYDAQARAWSDRYSPERTK